MLSSLLAPVSHRLASEAFALTEQYKDFRILAQLCNEPQAFEGQSVSGDTVSEAYIEKYEDAFAFELYRWYIDNGESFSHVVAQLLILFRLQVSCRSY